MLIPLKWLKEFVDIDLTPDVLADRLVARGFEMEGVTDLSEIVKNVKIGKILSKDKHPQADRLFVCSVDVGAEAPVQIVTNVAEVKPGDIVPVALDGARLADGKIIRSGEIRGIHSAGMMTSGGEIGLSESDYRGAGADTILVFRENLVPGTDVNTITGNDDIVLDIGVTANRTEANSVLGIAREVAAITGNPVKTEGLFTSLSEGTDINNLLSLENKADDLCPRYMATVVKDVIITESPEIIKKRLKAVGLRPINNIVDITNYVLYAIGQPLHAFDLSKIEGGKIVVRRAAKGETILALDDKTYNLSESDLVICNAKDPMAVAGVMGGKNYSVFPKTDTIVLESARFARDSVRRTSRSLGLRSDSSARFERGIDYWEQQAGMRAALALIEKYGWGKVVPGVLDSFSRPEPEKRIEFTPADIERILGVKIDKETIIKLLESITITTEEIGEKLISTVPLYRDDIFGVNDLAEEVIRLYGYDHIVTSPMKGLGIVSGGKTPLQEMTDKIKDILVGLGAFETVTYSFISPKAFDLLELPSDHFMRNAVRLDNPLGEDFSVMRTTLAHSMFKTLSTNLLRGNKTGVFFEIAKTYIPKSLPLKALPEERNKLAIGACGKDFYEFKSIIEELSSVLRIDVDFKAATLPYLHPTRTAEITDTATGAVIGYMGEVGLSVAENYGIDKTRVYFAELDEEYLAENGRNYCGFKVIPKYPAVERDIAVVVKEETQAKEIISAAKSAAGSILEGAAIFDVYSGGQVSEGMKSVAVKLTFRSADKTLTDAEVNAEIESVLAALAANLGAVLR